MVSRKVDEEKNDTKQEENDVGQQQEWLEALPDKNGNVSPNDSKNDDKSVEEYQHLSDALNAELCNENQLNDVMQDSQIDEVKAVWKAMSAELNNLKAFKGNDPISEKESDEGGVEQQNCDSAEVLMMEDRTEKKAIEKQLSIEKKLSLEKQIPMADLGSDSSDSDEDKPFRIGPCKSKLRYDIQRCLAKLKVPKDDVKQKPYDELCKMLVQPTYLYKERRRFYSARLGSKETDAEYLQRLTNLSNTCQFGKRQEMAISDKFIVTVMEKAYPGLSGSKSPWLTLEKEIDSKTALEISQKEDDVDDIDSLIDRFCGRGKKNSKKVPPHLAEIIRNEIMEKDLSVEWNDIAGLEFPKSIIKESIVWPMVRPDIFTGLRKLPKAMLLFGPPGTGKTMIAKCIAAQSKSTFFYVSASTMASKYHGESEQLVRALFAVAAEHQPSVIFFDEVDSLLTQRRSRDHDVSRRVKTEFMIHLDGAATKDDSRVLFIGATNRPQDLDEAARRRFVKRLYVPLPDLTARQQLLQILLKNHRCNLTDRDFNEIASMTNEFSGADIKWLCQDAAMEPLRSIPGDGIKDIQVADIRPLEMYDFLTSLKRIRPSVSSADLTALVEWDRLYGSNSDRPDLSDVHFMYS